MLEKRWNIKPQGEPALVHALAEALGIDNALATLLVQRDVTTFDEAKAFFRPSLQNLHNPFLMQDMDKAVARLERAMQQHEKIMVFGDYDVDGTTAVAMVYSFLKSLNANLIYSIPDRYIDGYGVSYRAINEAAQAGVALIIALDCGIKAVEKIDYARSKGIDFIVCDHHLPGSKIPEAVAVLDPQRADCRYPYKELSGCGVGFKLMQAYCEKNNIPFEQLEKYLDLVAVSIASDLVPITGENRVLAHYGLQRLNTKPGKGLKAIIRTAGIMEQQPLMIDDIVFRVGPRLNAAGRMESGATAVDLLIAETDQTAHEMGNIVNTQNNDRKNVDRNITHEAIATMEGNPKLKEKKTIVLFNPKWHKGVVGIVASRLVENFYRPSIVLTESNGIVTGSARSIPGFDLHQAIEACSELLINFGGHMYAAGLSLQQENLQAFTEKFESIAQGMLTPEMLIPRVDIDVQLNFKDITPKFYRILKQFQPFGPGNMSPIFLSRRAYGNGYARKVGADLEHLKTDLIQEDMPYHPFPTIAFGMAHIQPQLAAGRPVDICYSISENTYHGATSLQLRAKDMRPSE